MKGYGWWLLIFAKKSHAIKSEILIAQFHLKSLRPHSFFLPELLVQGTWCLSAKIEELEHYHTHVGKSY